MRCLMNRAILQGATLEQIEIELNVTTEVVAFYDEGSHDAESISAQRLG